MGRGNNWSMAEVAFEKGDYRIVNMPKQYERNTHAYVLERADGVDAMGNKRWVKAVIDDEPVFKWLVAELGNLAESIKSNK